MDKIFIVNVVMYSLYRENSDLKSHIFYLLLVVENFNSILEESRAELI